MNRDRPTPTEQRLEQLEREVAELKRRLDALERRPGYEVRPFALPETRQTTERNNV